MSLYHSGPAVIRSFQFRENTYEFTIESILMASHITGKLLIEASPGYLLGTPSDNTPQAQLTLDYTPQPDGHYRVRTIVTLVASRPIMVSGCVTLRDPTGEVRRLAIAIKASLLLSDTVLTLHKPHLADTDNAIAILKISQQGTDTPVVLSTDDPDRFGLATSGRSLFFPTLTITPATGPFYVFIRYTPDRIGQHHALLVVETPYDTQTVALRGEASKWVNWYWLSGGTADWRAWGKWLGQPVTIRIQPLHFLSSLAICGLLLASFIYRGSFTIGPSQRSHLVTADTTHTMYPGTTSVVPERYVADAIEQRFKNGLTRRISVDNLLVSSAKKLAGPPIKAASPTFSSAISAKIAKPRIVVRRHYQPLDRKYIASGPVSPASRTESELEKELNKRSSHKDRVEWVEVTPTFRVRTVARRYPRKPHT